MLVGTVGCGGGGNGLPHYHIPLRQGSTRRPSYTIKGASVDGLKLDRANLLSLKHDYEVIKLMEEFGKLCTHNHQQWV